MATLKEISKEIIDSHMETAINDNRYYPLKFLMENLQIFAEDFVDEQVVINYIEANYPSGYLLIDSDEFLKRIEEAAKDQDTTSQISIIKRMMSRNPTNDE